MVQGTMPSDAGSKRSLSADMQGFSLHAAVRCGADDRQALEQFVPLHHPAGLGQRAREDQRRRAGGAQAQDSLARRHQASGLVMSPLEFMQRPAALMPRPRLHLIRFDGVLVPNAKPRAGGAARA
jgi:hypothetical protein